jgi:outer membrane protein TolC
VRAEIAVSEARVEQAALAYERAVLVALADAEKALTRYHYSLQALEQQRLALAATAQGRSFARLRYEAGEGPLLEVLSAQRLVGEAGVRHAGAQTQAAVALVALYKALGGGWE